MTDVETVPSSVEPPNRFLGTTIRKFALKKGANYAWVRDWVLQCDQRRFRT